MKMKIFKIFRKKPKSKIKKSIRLIKSNNNPIISPSFYSWETRATFNPAAVRSDGKIYLLYRAIGDDDSSVLGYASSYDGLHIGERPTYSVYKRYKCHADYNNLSIDYISGGGWSGGCEDPRLSLIDDTLYMLYTAFDGWGSVRIALTSILFQDFKKKKWNWKKEVLISPKGEVHKNWVLFPEKINGKYAIMHSISPDILVDYFDDLRELDGKKIIESVHQNHPKWQLREKGIRGIGPTPIKTELGWLVLYHITEEGKYKLKAMILDKKDPTRILYRSINPILEPEEDYENHGIASGVVYSCGAVVHNEELFVYYGGADKYVCVASMLLKELLEDLKQNKPVKLRKRRKIK